MAPRDQLPRPFLVQMLQLLPMQQRLSCARVCKAWQQATVAATTEYPLKVTDQLQARKLAAWLQQHSAAARQLAYEIPSDGQFHVTEYALDLNFLRSFAVVTDRVEQLWVEASKLKGLLELCQQASHLTSLELNATRVSDWAAAAPLLRKLQSLKLGAVAAGDQQDNWLPGRHLSHLTALTSLELLDAAIPIEDATVACLPAMQQVSCLAKLRRLVLGHICCNDNQSECEAQQVFNMACKALTGLQCLTSPKTIHECGVQIDANMALAQLTGLQELRLTAG
jgi:hypothetical protein